MEPAFPEVRDYHSVVAVAFEVAAAAFPATSAEESSHLAVLRVAVVRLRSRLDRRYRRSSLPQLPLEGPRRGLPPLEAELFRQLVRRALQAFLPQAQL